MYICRLIRSQHKLNPGHSCLGSARAARTARANSKRGDRDGPSNRLAHAFVVLEHVVAVSRRRQVARPNVAPLPDLVQRHLRRH